MFYRFKQFRAELNRHQVKQGWRYFRRWKQSLEKDRNSIKDEQAWITFKAIDFLKAHLNRQHRVFEYGGGGSTLFFLNRVKEVVTVEHNEEWFYVLQKMITERGDKHWLGKLIKADQGDLVSSPDYSEPGHYSSDDLPSKGQNYKSYVSAIDSFPDGYFDCVLIDGRSRPSCIVHSAPKLRSGALLVLDNSDRSYYLDKTKNLLSEQFTVLFGEYGPSPYSVEFTHTTIWRKK